MKYMPDISDDELSKIKNDILTGQNVTGKAHYWNLSEIDKELKLRSSGFHLTNPKEYALRHMGFTDKDFEDVKSSSESDKKLRDEQLIQQKKSISVSYITDPVGLLRPSIGEFKKAKSDPKPPFANRFVSNSIVAKFAAIFN